MRSSFSFTGIFASVKYTAKFLLDSFEPVFLGDRIHCVLLFVINKVLSLYQRQFLMVLGEGHLKKLFLQQSPVLQKTTIYRSSRPEVFCKKGVLRNFAKFTGKHLRQSLLFNNLQLYQKRDWYRWLPVNLAKFLRTPFFTKHFWWMLLSLLVQGLRKPYLKNRKRFMRGKKPKPIQLVDFFVNL